MTQPRILVVEDDTVLALDLVERIELMGYQVAASVKTGPRALQAAEETRPDLVLMDIVLKGDLDGIQTSELMQARHDIPVVYLTAHTEEEVLKRAKITAPYGYLVKPCSESELRASVETALVRHELESRLRESEQRLHGIISAVTDHMTMIDDTYTIRWENSVARKALGKKMVGRKCYSVYHQQEHVCDDCVARKTFANSRPHECEIEVTDEAGNKKVFWSTASVAGSYSDGRPKMVVVVARDITERKRVEAEIRRSREQLKEYSATLAHKVRERTRTLEERTLELERANEALRLLIAGVEDQKKSLQGKIAENLRFAANPILDQLRTERLPARVVALLHLLETNLSQVADSLDSPGMKIAGVLTPREMRICELLRSGLSTKEMAAIMGVSPRTISFHRSNIRKKLRLENPRASLESHLRDLS